MYHPQRSYTPYTHGLPPVFSSTTMSNGSSSDPGSPYEPFNNWEVTNNHSINLLTNNHSIITI